MGDDTCPNRTLLKDRLFEGGEPASVKETRHRMSWKGGIGSYGRAGLEPPKRPGPKLYNTEKGAYITRILFVKNKI